MLIGHMDVLPELDLFKIMFSYTQHCLFPRMLMGRSDVLPELGSSRDLLIPGSEVSDDGEEVNSEHVLYTASFDELAEKVVQYDTIIWVSISLLLVLAWGVGLILLLCLPLRRYMFRKEVSSRKLYVTPTEIIYKVSRPSFVPFWVNFDIDRHVPLSQVIDIIIEQGCLQSMYGVHTFRIESIAHGKAAPVDDLQVQGLCDPELLRKVIVTEACKMIRDAGRGFQPTNVNFERENIPCMGSVIEGPAVLRSPMKNRKVMSSPHLGSVEPRGSTGMPSDFLLNKLEEVHKSVKKIELLIEKTPT
ncbi:uncharacterized protein LOC124944595 [Impatiens glandulifera]|uniref:uncharacterized protein LOC124944595 n=1 Tax=Impatiens glandulifera TaxID=253017 RepID=UPI001FB186E7|nr:uncharacterized protein LOC124944595 [Impatiens glandulifera]